MSGVAPPLLSRLSAHGLGSRLDTLRILRARAAMLEVYTHDSYRGSRASTAVERLNRMIYATRQEMQRRR